MRPGILKQALSIVHNLYIRRSCSFQKPEFWHRLGFFRGKALALERLVTILKWWPERELQRSKKHTTKTPKYGILIAFKDLFSFGLKVRQARRGGCLMDFQVSNRLIIDSNLSVGCISIVYTQQHHLFCMFWRWWFQRQAQLCLDVAMCCSQEESPLSWAVLPQHGKGPCSSVLGVCALLWKVPFQKP